MSKNGLLFYQDNCQVLWCGHKIYQKQNKSAPSGQALVAHALFLATQDAEIRRIMVQSQPRLIACETLSQKNPSQKRLIEWLKA
jgi:hypothetical protein